jgi:uncharacterized protein YeaO (DUF488 family)
MTLRVYAARLGTRDPDALNITRKSATGDGLAFAPSWAILRPALDARRAVEEMLRVASGSSEVAGLAADEAAMMWAEAWAAYVPAYVEEMRASYRRDRGPWERLLARGRVVLACYCTDAEHCHRALLGSVILPKLGAVWCGEVTK